MITPIFYALKYIYIDNVDRFRFIRSAKKTENFETKKKKNPIPKKIS